MKETRKWIAALLAGAAAVGAAAAGLVLLEPEKTQGSKAGQTGIPTPRKNRLGNLPAKRAPCGRRRPSPRREPKPKKQRRPAHDE